MTDRSSGLDPLFSPVSPGHRSRMKLTSFVSSSKDLADFFRPINAHNSGGVSNFAQSADRLLAIRLSHAPLREFWLQRRHLLALPSRCLSADPTFFPPPLAAFSFDTPPPTDMQTTVPGDPGQGDRGSTGSWQHMHAAPDCHTHVHVLVHVGKGTYVKMS